jgi:hypothetical protein
MPSDDELRELLSTARVRDVRAPGALDAGRVIARAKARRRPRQLAVGAVGVLAIAAVALAGFQLSRVDFATSIALVSPASGGAGDTESSTLEEGTFDSGAARAKAEELNLCGGALAEVAPGSSGLQLDVMFPESAPVGARTVDGVVRMTNLGPGTVAGTTAASPTITLSQDGIVLWHSNGPTLMSVVVVDLAPGESLEYPASFTPARCDLEDDLSAGFRPDLPMLPAGEYQLSAALDVSVGIDAEAVLATSPLATIQLG